MKRSCLQKKNLNIETMTHGPAIHLQKYSDIVFRIIDNLKRFKMFHSWDLYSKLPQIEMVGDLGEQEGTGAEVATQLMILAFEEPGFEDADEKIILYYYIIYII